MGVHRRDAATVGPRGHRGRFRVLRFDSSRRDQCGQRGRARCSPLEPSAEGRSRPSSDHSRVRGRTALGWSCAELRRCERPVARRARCDPSGSVDLRQRAAGGRDANRPPPDRRASPAVGEARSDRSPGGWCGARLQQLADRHPGLCRPPLGRDRLGGGPPDRQRRDACSRADPTAAGLLASTGRAQRCGRSGRCRPRGGGAHRTGHRRRHPRDHDDRSRTGDGGCGFDADPSGPAQPCFERTRRHAARRSSADSSGQRRCGAGLDGGDRRGRSARVLERRGRGRGHGRRHPGPSPRAVLHDQGARRWNRAWVVDCAWHRAGKRRRHHLRLEGRRRHDGASLATACRGRASGPR